jgi:hypothetical protein
LPVSSNLFPALGHNLVAGLRAAFGAPLRIGHFHVDADQAVVLPLFGPILAIALDCL